MMGGRAGLRAIPVPEPEFGRMQMRSYIFFGLLFAMTLHRPMQLRDRR
jgi:hypothetical protein